MQNVRKWIAILLLMPCMFILTGCGEKAVELLNDTSIIDLSKAIKDTPIGNQGNTLKLVEDDIVDNMAINSPEEAATLLEDKKILYIIEIRDKRITYNDSECNIDDLESKIKKDCVDGAGKVQLIDNFAEASVYSDVLAMLERLGETIGLEYTYE